MNWKNKVDVYYRLQLSNEAELIITNFPKAQTIRQLKKAVELIEIWSQEDSARETFKEELLKHLDDLGYEEDWRKTTKPRGRGRPRKVKR